MFNWDMVRTDTRKKSEINLLPSERIWTFELYFNGSRSPFFILLSSVSAAFYEDKQGIETLECF